MVCTLTGGERGDILNPAMDRPEIKADIGAVRRAEMARAREILGVDQRFLGFIDSGLPEGDPKPSLPEGCFALMPAAEAAEPLVRAIREFRPHVMLTYDVRRARGRRRVLLSQQRRRPWSARVPRGRGHGRGTGLPAPVDEQAVPQDHSGRAGHPRPAQRGVRGVVPPESAQRGVRGVVGVIPPEPARAIRAGSTQVGRRRRFLACPR